MRTRISWATGPIAAAASVALAALGPVTVSNELVVTVLYHGVLIAFNRSTGAIVYRHQLPATANAPITIAGNAALVPAGGPETSASGGGGQPQLVAYTVA